MSPLDQATRIVIKLGSALIVDRDAKAPRAAWLRTLADDIALLRAEGKQVILVSSGAAALGRIELAKSSHQNNRTGALELKQAAAALGQPRLMTALSEAFEPHDISLAQTLLTIEDTEVRRRWLNARATLFTLLDHDAIPVINENDTVATSELRYGDNDRLAARVAQMVGADALILLSDIDGIYTADPRNNPNAEHIAELKSITPEIRGYAGSANAQAGVGTGGMITKLDAADIALSAGCSTAITLGNIDHPLKRLVNGGRASWVLADVTPQAARRSWLSGHLTPEGSLTIDDGAQKALLKGASLLPVGIKRVSGAFMRGAALSVYTLDGTLIAKGVTTYSSSEIEQIRGLQSADVSQRLGYPARTAVIHRDDMILVEGDH